MVSSAEVRTGTALVTGANGFVGGALMERLLEEGVRVVGATRKPLAGRREIETPTLGAYADWRSAVAGVDVIVHTAARAHVLGDRKGGSLEVFREINVRGTLRLAEQAAAAGVRRFIFISSIGVNGNCSERPFTEEDAPAPIEPYAISKFEAEVGLRELAAKSGLDLVVIRPPLVYGPGAPGNFGRLVRAVRSGTPLPLGAVRHNRRTLVALDNLVDLIITCMHHPAAANQTILAGDGEDLSTTDLLRRLATALGVAPRLIPVPVSLLEAVAGLLGMRGMVQRLCGNLQVDISRARRLLGWTPPVTVDEGLRRVGSQYLMRGRP